MRIAGFTPFSLSDFPGRVSAIIFCQGCNFRCPFCHNGNLIAHTSKNGSMPLRAVERRLLKRRKVLDGVVITGGEPTLQEDLGAYIRHIKALGFQVKLDTNGSRPQILEALLADGALDFIAMDVKAPINCYDRLAGVHLPTERIARSIELIASSGIEHEFRTTAVDPLLSKEEMRAVREMIPNGSPHRFQRFVPENALDANLRRFAAEWKPAKATPIRSA